MKVYDALADAFVAEGTDAIFGLMGGGNAHFMASFAQHPGARLYDCRHESSGLSMADGWARVTGRPGVCTVTCGPGVTQLATSLVVARRAGTPLVVFAADLPEGGPDHQLFNQARFAEAVEAGFVRVNAPKDAHDAVRRAFYLARTESRPVFLDGPMDVLEMEFAPHETYVPSKALIPAAQPIAPDPAQVAEAVRILRASCRPVIVAGRGAVAAGAGDVIRSLARKTGALIATSLLCQGFLADDEFSAGVAGSYATSQAMELFREADCVIGAGASLNYFTLGAGFRAARFIQIDRRPNVLMGSGRAADCYVQADARVALEAILAALDDQPASAGMRTPEVSRKLRAGDGAALVSDDAAVDPRAAVRVLDEALPEGFGLVAGNGHFTAFLTELRRPRRPYTVTVAFGCIGQALGNAIGATVATGSPMVCIDGDSSIMMTLVEFDTLARYALPLLVVVMNDQALGAEYHRLQAQAKPAGIAHIATPDLGAVARAFGLRGRLVQRLDELAPAIAEFAADPKPTVIDLRVSREVLSPGFQRLFERFEKSSPAGATGA